MASPELEAAAATPLNGAKTPPTHAMKIDIEKRAAIGGGGGDMTTPVTEVGVARATRMAMQAKAQVETLLTFGDLDADYVEAAPTNKMILTPLLGGVSSELIEEDERWRPAVTRSPRSSAGAMTRASRVRRGRQAWVTGQLWSRERGRS
jgi:hypothetical protein